jgi:allantoin racemase
VIDGIGAAVRLAEAIVGLGLATSKVSTYAPPDPKQITGWPVSQALGLRAGATAAGVSAAGAAGATVGGATTATTIGAVPRAR